MHLVAALLVTLVTHPQEPEPAPKSTVMRVRLEAGENERHDFPVRLCVPLERVGLGSTLAQYDLRGYLLAGDDFGSRLNIDVQANEVAVGGRPHLEVCWVHPRLDERETAEQRVFLRPTGRPEASVRESALSADRVEGTRDLLVGAQPLLRYVHAFDPERRDATYKVYHHIFDLAGDHLLTKGPGGLHSHHRGVFVGWNRTLHAGESQDFWSCGGGQTIRHRRHLDVDSNGTVTNAQGAEIEWVTADGRALVAERRIARAWRIRGGMHLFDFDVELRALEGPVELRGDPHHSGFQVRLDQGHTEDEPPAIEFLRPKSAEDLGNDIWTGCDWVAARFPMHGVDYVLVHMDAPDNPRPIRYSTRPYGRFGSTFEKALDSSPLRLRYRLVLWDSAVHGAPDRATCEGLYRDFAEPVKITLVE